jgi:hypothetical protein
MRLRIPLVLMLGFAVTSAAIAQDEAEPGNPLVQAWETEAMDRIARHAEALAARGDSQGLLMALLIAPYGGDGADAFAAQRPVWREALKALPATPASAWYLRSQCHGSSPGCDEGQALETLSTVAADDPWVRVLRAGEALERGDTVAALAELQAAGAGPVDARWQHLLRPLREALAGVDLPPMDDATAQAMAERQTAVGKTQPAPASAALWRDTYAMAMLAANALPEFSALQRVCGGESPLLSDPGGREACLAFLQRLVAEDPTLAGRSAGYAFALRIAEGGHQREALAAGQRRLRWLQQQGAQAVRLLETRPGGLEGYLQEVFDRGELPALMALLEREGLPLSPPVDWAPSWPWAAPAPDAVQAR